ncbi:copper homeostasis membrane protein CopD [Dickeya solani]|uniref:Copper resistance protein D n=1 Tax=Dickeya solani TaxID=1089444 RepID=A0ABU4E9F9_9GAMM|nr:copper homeostasis membrane protein CopD [Dickeya solani]MCA6998789.1 copper homeostasis membrane protein CopD [Dickeya solani]MCZ0822240.1 copper homeostasis membrane protein CopD [Dickeya solani]MDV6994661.1 copper homeostasis membrane protein CopD [Dickeya solani]MDV7004040.1 copper homeostasis membrane protein CopD [Dickeya solani]MDV7039789.1 copper homeostasis membrane protein CopD [Dickeya solani]
MTLEWLYALSRLGHFSSLMLLVGSACYSTLLSPRTYQARLASQLHGLMVIGCVAALLTAVAILAAQAGLMSGDWRNIGDASIWHAVLGTRFGNIWLWQPVLALMTCVMFFWRSRYRQAGVLILGILQLGGMGWVGHAAMLEGRPGVLHCINQVVHLLSVTFWVGGLPPLLFVLQDARLVQTRTDAILTMMRFSRYGHLAVAVAILTGLVSTRLILGWPLPGAGLYSALLAVKILLVAIMALLALFNRYWVVPRFQRANSAAYGYFLRLTTVELALSVLIIALVSFFATLSPV